MTDLSHAYEFAVLLHDLLATAIADVERVRGVVDRLSPLAPTFPETRFCKGCVLPVVDRAANVFLRDRYGASANGVYRALRCEGFANLREYYTRDDGQTHFSSFTQVRTDQTGSKAGAGKTSRPSPDFCIRYANPSHAFRMVGEVKYAPKTGTRGGMVEQIRHELSYYLSIKSDEKTDWGHDFGYGLAYAAGGDGRVRRASLITDFWASDHILISCFEEA